MESQRVADRLVAGFQRFRKLVCIVLQKLETLIIAMRRFPVALAQFVATLFLTLPSLVSAQATAFGSLDLDSISATPTSGSINWSGAWTLDAVSSANNSLGEISDGLDFGESSSAAASSSVTYASGNTSAGSPGPAAASAHVDGTVNLPAGNIEAAVGSFGNNVTLETQFSLEGTADANVTFSALIQSLLSGSTGLGGQILHDKTIFNFNVDSNPVLFFDDPQTAGPGSSFSDTENLTLSSTIDISSGWHDLFIELDTEQEAITTSVPETPSALVWVEAAGLLFAFRRRWSGRKSV